jgi:predicted PurR-regulated permease PerM
MNTTDHLGTKIAAQLIIFSFIVAVFIIGKSVLIPFAWSLLISLASINMMEKIENKIRLPRGLLILIYILFIIAIITLVVYFFYVEINFILSDLQSINQRISGLLHDLSERLTSLGIHIPDHIDREFIHQIVQKNTSSIFSFVSALGLNLWNIILIIFYMFFLLYYREIIPLFFQKKLMDEKRITAKREEILQSVQIIRNYLSGTLLITLISGIMNYAIFLIFGLPYALFFAFFLAVLNLIPYIGNPIGLLVIVFFSLITYDTMLIPILIFIALFIANFLQDNVIRPWLIGDKLKLNAFTVFIAVILGGAIWGVSGMILFIPLVGIIKIILEHNEKTAPYALFLSDVPASTISKPPEELDDYFLKETTTKKKKSG